MSQGNPTYYLYINGKRISPEQEATVKSLQINKRLNASSSFTVKVSDNSRSWQENFKELMGSEFRILLGDPDHAEEMITGELTGMRVHYSRSGIIVTLTGRDRLHRLENRRTTRTFSNMTYGEIIRELCSAREIDCPPFNLGEKQGITVQRKLSDYDFLLQIAEEYNSFFYVNNRALLWKPFEPGRGEDTVLEWNKSLMEFLPRCETGGLYSSMEIRSWDMKKQKTRAVKVTSKELGTQGGIAVAENFGAEAGRSVTAYYDIKGYPEVEKRAEAALQRNNSRYITAEGRTTGHTNIQQGTILRMEGLGEKFSGKYMVTSASHTLIPCRGYITNFQVFKI